MLITVSSKPEAPKFNLSSISSIVSCILKQLNIHRILVWLWLHCTKTVRSQVYGSTNAVAAKKFPRRNCGALYCRRKGSPNAIAVPLKVPPTQLRLKSSPDAIAVPYTVGGRVPPTQLRLISSPDAIAAQK